MRKVIIKMRFFRKRKQHKRSEDVVVFMAAYEVNEFKKNFILFKKHINKKVLMQKHHISGISHDGLYLTPEHKIRYTSEFNPIELNSVMHFDFADKKAKESFDQKELEAMIYTTSFEQRARALLDEEAIEISTSFNMESFLVEINKQVFQVDPIAFFLNTSLIVTFELINFNTGIPLTNNDIYGRSNNFSILPIQKIKYFNEEQFAILDKEKHISDVIYDNIWDFFESVGNNKWIAEQYSYLHNILVISNNIKEPEGYFQNVLGAKIDNFSLSNLGSNSEYQYYAKEFLALVTNVTEESKADILVDIQVLEAFKMYLYLQLIIDYDINHELNKLVDNQAFVKSLLFPRHVPIITMNVIDNLKDTVTFKASEQALEFKIETLKLLQQRKRNNNGIFLNVLLFILALISSLQSLDILHREFGIPFRGGLVVVSLGFISLLIVWLYKENKIK